MNTKSLGYRLFGWGQLPTRWRHRLEAEGILLHAEGAPIRVTYRHYRALGRRYGYKRSYGSGSVALSKQRLVVFYYRWPILNIPVDHPGWHNVDITNPQSNVLHITVEASDLDSQRSGEIDIQCRSTEAMAFLHACSNAQSW